SFLRTSRHLHSVDISGFSMRRFFPFKVKLDQIWRELTPGSRLVHIGPETIDSQVGVKSHFFGPPEAALMFGKLWKDTPAPPNLRFVDFPIEFLYKEIAIHSSFIVLIVRLSFDPRIHDDNDFEAVFSQPRDHRLGIFEFFPIK